jgi:hypothetical protein
MKKNYSPPGLFSAAAVTLILISAVSAEENSSYPYKQERVEKYRYRVIPHGQNEPADYYFADMEFRHGDTLVLLYRADKEDERVRMRFEIAPDNQPLMVYREELSGAGEREEADSIRRIGNRAYIREFSGRWSDRQYYDIPDRKVFAVDASLLHALRDFPFGEGREPDFFMIDFEGRSVTVTAREACIETVEVPAGQFRCYRIEVEVNIFLFNPVIYYWLAEEEPHHLIKNVGKRGPFTPTFVTELFSIE